MKPIPENIYCPRCGSKKIWNDGSWKGKKNYECKDCHRNFCEEAIILSTDVTFRKKS